MPNRFGLVCHFGRSQSGCVGESAYRKHAFYGGEYECHEWYVPTLSSYETLLGVGKGVRIYGT